MTQYLQALETLLNWEEAREECRYRGGWYRGGDLASINSFQEQTFLTSMLKFLFLCSLMSPFCLC